MWPQYNSEDNPYFGDGKTYGRELGRISPEGNTYGTLRFVREFVHPVWWTGAAWTDVEVTGRVDYYTQLPTQRPFGEIWQAANEKGYIVEYFKDVSDWKRLNWKWDVDSFDNLPRPGNFVGEAHKVKEYDVPMVWTGYAWERLKHEALEEDQANRHLPPGFLQFLAPDARVVFISPNEVNLQAVKGGSGKVWVNGEYVAASLSTSVYNHLVTLEWDSQNNAIVTAPVTPSTDYFIYLANTNEPAFNLTDWDFRGKLFLSRSEDTNGYFSSIGAGRSARLVGQIRTDASDPPLFVPEIDISLISRTTNFPETFREYSDYLVSFVDQDNLELTLIDGNYGQIYCAGELVYLGSNYEIPRNGIRVSWNDTLENKLELDTSEIQPDTQYYVYLAASVDAFNFNAINEDTNRPWQGSDPDYNGNYDASLDLRQVPFLSTKNPDQGRMSGQWPGYYSRLLGRVTTDGMGFFTNARDLSAIRQPTLNPSYFDGLAECQLERVSNNEMRLVRKLATSGVINVAGEAVQTYERLELEKVHRIFSTDNIMTYIEAQLEAPLTASNQVTDHPGETVYLYIANSAPHWGELASKTFFTAIPPTRGSLSRNWPGNTARWIATLRVDTYGGFSGSPVLDSLSPVIPTIDDGAITVNSTWSSSRIMSEINLLRSQISANAVFQTQKIAGCSLLLRFLDHNTATLVPASGSVCTVVTPNLEIISVTSEGISLDTSNLVTGTSYKVYLNSSGMYASLDEPSEVFSNMEILGEDSVLVGWVSCGSSNGYMDAEWNVLSFWNEPEMEWIIPIPRYTPSGTTLVQTDRNYDNVPQSKSLTYSVYCSVPGFLLNNKCVTSFSRTGTTSFRAQSKIIEGGVATDYAVSTPLDSFGSVSGVATVFGTDDVRWTVTLSDGSGEKSIITDNFALQYSLYIYLRDYTYSAVARIVYSGDSGNFVISRAAAQ